MALVPFTKPALTVAAQVALLEERHLIIADHDYAEKALNRIGFYRLSGYMVPFAVPHGVDPEHPHTFVDGTTIEQIIELYEFDRKLRLFMNEALERVEVFTRCAMTNSMAPTFGPHWYMQPKLFKPHIVHADLLTNIKRQIGHGEGDRKNRDVHIAHYYGKYNDPEMPACWMIEESVSFSTTSMMFGGIASNEILPVSKSFGVNHDILCSWLHALSYARNLCAHHGRLWNRTLTIKPKIPRQFAQLIPTNDRIYAIFFILQFMLIRITDNNDWAEKLRRLLADHATISIDTMGFPANWKTKTTWRFPPELQH